MEKPFIGLSTRSSRAAGALRARMVAGVALSVAALAAAGPTKADTVGAFAEVRPNGVSVVGNTPAQTVNLSSGTLPSIQANASYSAQASIPYQGPISAASSAYGDLTSGKVGTYVSTTEGAAGRAIGSWSTLVTLSNPNVGATETWDLGFIVRDHGTIRNVLGTAPGLPDLLGQGTSQLDVYVGGQSIVGFQTTGQFRAFFGSTPFSSVDGVALKNLTTAPGGPDETVFTFNRRVFGQTVTLGITMVMDTSASNGFVADFGNTAGFGFDLPPGVTFTSASGNFLTATGGVPEPATWAMLVVGFGSAGAILRRRRLRVS